MNQETAWRQKVVPCPVAFCVNEGYFRLDAGASMEIPGGDEAVVSVGRYLIEHIKVATGYALDDPGTQSAG